MIPLTETPFEWKLALRRAFPMWRFMRARRTLGQAVHMPRGAARWPGRCPLLPHERCLRTRRKPRSLQLADLKLRLPCMPTRLALVLRWSRWAPRIGAVAAHGA